MIEETDGRKDAFLHENKEAGESAYYSEREHGEVEYGMCPFFYGWVTKSIIMFFFIVIIHKLKKNRCRDDKGY